MPSLTNEPVPPRRATVEKTPLGVYAKLIAFLNARAYGFICPTPETHARVIAKRGRLADGSLVADSLQDIFGWSIPACASTDLFPPELLAELVDSKVLVRDNDVLRSTVRVSSLSLSRKHDLYVHGSWPTVAPDSIFFGPDSYRYMRVLTSLAALRLQHRAPSRILDLCTGPGVGALHLSRLFPDAEVFGVDINPKALAVARFNAPTVQFKLSDGLANYDGPPLDVVAIHPPFIAGDARVYAAGGPTGIELTLRLISEAHRALRKGGELWSYTAVPVAFDGSDAFRTALESDGHWHVARYELVDADIFGEEMDNDSTYPCTGSLQAIELALVKV
ncbi:S-adenosyl-L-methionine-dependent methyltransferase [Auricularia subglabra TFB-10046 SS5]|nr:S-adenosyl-L-methionine-dependent methyltransferase [Auricularia subglabra TFB-10046 SS5]